MTYQLQTADVPHHQTTTETTDADATASSGLLFYSSYAATTIEVVVTTDVVVETAYSAVLITDADVKSLSSSYSFAAAETALSATKYH